MSHAQVKHDDSRLYEEFEKVDAPQLRNLLTLICNNKGFTLKHRHGKLFVKPEKVFLVVDGFHEGKPRLNNFRDCDNYTEREKDVEIEVEDVPIKSKYEIYELFEVDKRKHPGRNQAIFKCENCCSNFCNNNNPSNDCLWHPGQKAMDLDDIMWADYDPKRDGATESLIDHPDFEDRWIWSCCYNSEAIGVAKTRDTRYWKKSKNPEIHSKLSPKTHRTNRNSLNVTDNPRIWNMLRNQRRRGPDMDCDSVYRNQESVRGDEFSM